MMIARHGAIDEEKVVLGKARFDMRCGSDFRYFALSLLRFRVNDYYAGYPTGISLPPDKRNIPKNRRPMANPPGR